MNLRLRFSVLLGVTLVPFALGAQGMPSGFFDEIDGRIIIEAESIGDLPASWQNRMTTEAPDLSDPGAATGGDFIIWEGSQSLNNPGNGLLVYPIRINTPGEYRFCWRSQVSNGSSPTDHNDSWLKINADAFFGRKGNGDVVCPKGFDPQENDCAGEDPEGSGREGWFKVYSSGTTDWTFSTRTSDNDPHQIYARFDTPGDYAIRVSARSSFHALDRFTLSSSLSCEQNLELPESPFINLDRIFGDRFQETF